MLSVPLPYTSLTAQAADGPFDAPQLDALQSAPLRAVLVYVAHAATRSAAHLALRPRRRPAHLSAVSALTSEQHEQHELSLLRYAA